MRVFITFFLCANVILSCHLPCKKSKSEVNNEHQKLSYFINKYGDTVRIISKPTEEWKKILTPSEFHILREKGTEQAFSGDLLNNSIEGIYTCRGCGLPLFYSKQKYDSGTGWPSFKDVYDEASILTSKDENSGLQSTELMCAKCGGHLGHLFKDGLKPKQFRFCINSASLDFIKTEN